MEPACFCPQLGAFFLRFSAQTCGSLSELCRWALVVPVGSLLPGVEKAFVSMCGTDVGTATRSFQ